MFDEIWRDIPGYEGYYQCSSHGRIKSLDRVVSNGKRKQGRILKAMVTEKGYCKVELRKDHKRIHARVHRIVALTFIPNLKNKEEVNHIDGEKENNCCYNLEWSTRKQNMNHAKLNALIKPKKGIRHPGSLLTEKEVMEIRTLCDSKIMTKRKIGSIYNVSESTIGNVYKRKTWKHI